MRGPRNFVTPHVGKPEPQPSKAVVQTSEDALSGYSFGIQFTPETCSNAAILYKTVSRILRPATTVFETEIGDSK